MSKNKTGKYFKYAVGEIILVVFGILIALSINNWNEKRISSNKEKVLMAELHEEFIYNKLQLEEVLSWHKKVLKASNNIINMFPIDLETVNFDSLQKHFVDTGWRYTFNPSQGIINSLVNTSSFELISNDTLRKLIISWSDILADFQDEETNALIYLNESILPFYEEHFEYSGNFRDKRNNLDALKSLKFESIIRQRRGDMNDILSVTGELDVVKTMINQIIELSNTEKYD